MRLNRYLSLTGISSRRKAEQFILEGKISVNGEVVKLLGTQINEDKDVVRIDGEIINYIPKECFTYLVFHKPKGCLCTASDDRNRKTIFDYINIDKTRLFSVGRLDYNTEGIILLTNDGEMANKLMHPSYEIPKKYSVKINSSISESELAQLRKGVLLDDGHKTLPAKIRVTEKLKEATKLDVTIKEGKNRQIHRMFKAIGKEVIFLKRTDYGPIHLGGLSRGSFRPLSNMELEMLRSVLGD
ncbi:MAG: Ribosomal large subunit pseudouridine synthase B [Firmicutes bacterium ADurb.Bin080]|jgi:23S rRNA pseudouridine2605 synthase|nr:rRNA pseudouridine synthase [Clostridiales bacterium]OQC16465.1 MAG: Ribosomal large subunit pseudouridine synthase B [Firmicutes bacterium ADurb.Bin080]